MLCLHLILFCLFGLVFSVPVNSCGHVGTVISPNHTFYLGKLDYVDNQYMYFVHILSLVTDNNPSRNKRKGGEWR